MNSNAVTMKPTFRVPSPLLLGRLFPPEAVLVGLEHRTKTAVIEELVHQAVALAHLPGEAEQSIVATILRREELSSTALGNGVAFPHCVCQPLDHVVGVAGLLRYGVPFDAWDGKPVNSLFLTLAPDDAAEEYSHVMGRLVSIGRNKSLHLLLRGCRTSENVSRFLGELDSPRVAGLGELARLSLTSSDPNRGTPRDELARFGLIRPERPDASRPR